MIAAERRVTTIEFNAPWSRSLKIASIIRAAILIAIMATGYSYAKPGSVEQSVLILLPLAALLIALACIVRGYTLTEESIKIKRLGRTTTLPLAGLRAVEGNVEALSGALSLFANRGLLSFTGIYWSRRLKLLRAYATDPSRAIVLRYPTTSVVITPHYPQQFIVRARTFLQTANFPK